MEEKITQNGTTDDGQDKKSAKKAAKHDGGVADLERVTDYAEEKELSSADISNVRPSICCCFHFSHRNVYQTNQLHIIITTLISFAGN